MPALNFKAEFAPSVLSGAKKMTIRKERKFPIIVGDPLYLYTGMRTASCRRLGSTHCSMEHDICIHENGTVLIDGQAIYRLSIHRLAQADGFESVTEFLNFFRSQYGLPFRGQLIEWESLDKGE